LRAPSSDPESEVQELSQAGAEGERRGRDGHAGDILSHGEQAASQFGIETQEALPADGGAESEGILGQEGDNMRLDLP
jgi:hypothetical protein